jgi:pimeloyl-ACP methyl ester carboxylesterase
MTLLLTLAAPVLLLTLGAAFTSLYARRIERRFPPTGRFIEVEGCRLHYREVAPTTASPRGTIVLLHGASSNLVESMLGMGAALSQKYRVIAVDRPGHGWSERRQGLREAEPDRQAVLIAGVLRKLGVRKAVIVGHSWSGTIVPHFALDHADVTGAIVVLSGITSPWPGGYIGWYRHLIDSRFGWLMFRTLAVPVLLMLRPWMKAKTFRPQPPPPGIVTEGFIPLAFRPRAYEVNMQDFAVMYDAVQRLCGRYRDIQVPALVIAGDSDEIVWTDLHSRCFARDVPGAELIVMPGIGHMPQYADKETVLSAIETLAERISPARAEVDQA